MAGASMTTRITVAEWRCGVVGWQLVSEAGFSVLGRFLLFFPFSSFPSHPLIFALHSSLVLHLHSHHLFVFLLTLLSTIPGYLRDISNYTWLA